jgi:eukaryotic-like serine/threonine-protein kinase
MTSTIIGLPDRYRPLDEIGPEEQTETGVIRSWRAKDRVLNRDVAVRVHTPSGAAAHGWITRALTAGGLANPALAMVYDASEGSDGDDGDGTAAYVVNEWIDGETLAERLTRGPLPERELRPLLRRLADAVAEAHRVGLALGGLTPESVVLRPNGLVGVRAVPAATGTMEGDINALGELLAVCLRGTRPEDAAAPLAGPPDLVTLARRARSSEPGQGISSVAAMAALLAERPRGGTTGRADDGDARRSRARERRSEPLFGARRGADQPGRAAAAAAPPAAGQTSDDAPVPLDPQELPPVPPTRPAGGPATAAEAPLTGRRGDTVSVPVPAAAVPGPQAGGPPGRYGEPFVLDDDAPEDDYDDLDDDSAGTESELTAPPARRRVLVVALPILALVVVVGLAWWFGSSVLSVAGSYDDLEGSTPSSSESGGGSASASASEKAPEKGGPVDVEDATVFDPGGDGQPENDDRVAQSYDGDEGTAWPTLTYQGDPAFGNLKDGVGVVYDLGKERTLAGATLATTMPGSKVEIHAASGTDGSLDDWPLLAEGTLDESTDLTFDKPAKTRYVLVWITELVQADGGFTADLAEVSLLAAS